MSGTKCPYAVQAEYWRRRTTRTEKNGETHVEYGNDVEGTAFCDTDSNDPLGSSPWNMRVSCGSIL